MLSLLENNNLAAFIFTFLPALIYAMIVYVTVPSGTIRWKSASLYFIMGVLSTVCVTTFHFIFPQWHSPASTNLITALFIYAMIQVAFLEEGCKYLCFKATESYRSIKRVDHPSAVMFYAMSISCGFAVAENILYARMYGGDVLLIRSFTSVILHMVCGMMMGYFVALGKMGGGKGFLNSLSPRKRMLCFTGAGIMASTFFHGLYDFNIFLLREDSMGNTINLVVIGMLLAYFMSSNLYERFKDVRDTEE